MQTAPTKTARSTRAASPVRHRLFVCWCNCLCWLLSGGAFADNDADDDDEVDGRPQGTSSAWFVTLSRRNSFVVVARKGGGEWSGRRRRADDALEKMSSSFGNR
jgi:hypothetical protein